jgi:hypothetical protein
MTKTKYNLELLEQCIARDNAKLEKDYSNILLNRDLKIEFSCSCSQTNCIKTFRQVYEKSGSFCKKCTHNNGWTKKKETWKVNLGVEHPSQSNTIKVKKIETCRKNYGVDYPSHSIAIKDKIKKTCREKYGGDNPMNSSTVKIKIKETCKKKYGFENALQNPNIAEKASKNAYKSKDYILPSGNIVKVQGYEPFAYKILLDTYSETDIINNRTEVPEIWWVDINGKNHRYYVDFYIPKDNLLIEVKSKRTYTLDDKKEKIEKTLEASFNKGFNIELWVIGNKGEIIEKIIKYH